MHLPPATERLWAVLQHAKELNDFVLIGGTALALQIGHRISEDLDFIPAHNRTLPRGRIRSLNERLAQLGWNVRATPSPALVAEYEDSGRNWADYQQDFVADDPDGGSVKLTFVIAEPENLLCLVPAKAGTTGPRVAEIEELFRLKCIAAADRTKSRDWLDLYLLLQSGKFTHLDFIEAFERAGVPQKREIALLRMTQGKLNTTDEGFSALLTTPPTLEQMRNYFEALEDSVEQELAAREFAAINVLNDRNGESG